jgi:hypothetical protein
MWLIICNTFLVVVLSSGRSKPPNVGVTPYDVVVQHPPSKPDKRACHVSLNYGHEINTLNDLLGHCGREYMLQKALVSNPMNI